MSGEQLLPWHLYIHLTKWWFLRIRRFEGRFIYEKKATDLRIIRIRTHADYLISISHKTRLKLKTFILAPYLTGLGLGERNRKKAHWRGRATSPVCYCPISFETKRVGAVEVLTKRGGKGQIPRFLRPDINLRAQRAKKKGHEVTFFSRVC